MGVIFGAVALLLGWIAAWLFMAQVGVSTALTRFDLAVALAILIMLAEAWNKADDIHRAMKKR